LQTNNHRHVLRSDHIQILNAKLADQIRDHKQAHHNNISSFAISLSRAFARARAHTKKNLSLSLSLSLFKRWEDPSVLLHSGFLFSLSFLLSTFSSLTDRLTGRRHYRCCRRRRRPRWVLGRARTN
jgi:hypothetical protein